MRSMKAGVLWVAWGEVIVASNRCSLSHIQQYAACQLLQSDPGLNSLNYWFHYPAALRACLEIWNYQTQTPGMRSIPPFYEAPT
jgi:hypothetical protein